MITNLSQESFISTPGYSADQEYTNVFNFGSRHFHFVLLQLKPMLQDETELKTDLPKPGVKDNQDLANQAIQEWK